MDPLTPSKAVFVVGSPRSGTSALAWALAQHPDFWTSAESDFILPLYGRNRLREVYDSSVADITTRPRWLKKHDVGYAEFARYVGYGLDCLYRSRSGGRRWVEQSPSYTMMLQDLLLLFPGASMLHAVRDGRRVVASMLKSGFPMPWATDFKKACQTWSAFALRGLHASRAHPDRVLEVRNEALIADPAAACARIFAFLEAPEDAQPAAFLRASWVNSSYGDDRQSAERAPWEAWSLWEKRTFESEAGEAMDALGYPVAL
ncbi:MAG: sulfotransferase [Rhodothermales bacterium]|nr:sulfotransferase [Rhodothermales bacterium]